MKDYELEINMNDFEYDFENDARIDITYDISTQIISKMEMIIKEAITAYLGNSDYTPEDIAQRGSKMTNQKGIETFFFDGYPILEIYQIKDTYDN